MMITASLHPKVHRGTASRQFSFCHVLNPCGLSCRTMLHKYGSMPPVREHYIHCILSCRLLSSPPLMSLARVMLLAIQATCNHLACTLPNPTPSAKGRYHMDELYILQVGPLIYSVCHAYSLPLLSLDHLYTPRCTSLQYGFV